MKDKQTDGQTEQCFHLNKDGQTDKQTNRTMSHLESGVLEVHDGVGDTDVQLEDDLLHVEGTRQTVHQTQETL